VSKLSRNFEEILSRAHGDFEEKSQVLECSIIITNYKIFIIIKAYYNYLMPSIIIILGDRGSTVVKVLCYKSEGRWFGPSWCHWIFY